MNISSAKKYVIMVVLLLSPGIRALAQDGNPLQFLGNVSQSSFINPAHQNKTDKLVVGLPFLSGTHFEWDANFALDYIFSERFSYSFDRFYHSLDGPGDGISEGRIPLVFLSLKEQNHTWTFSVSEKFTGAAHFDREVLKFIDRGTMPYYGNDDSFGPLTFTAQYFREVAVGISTEIWEGFDVGVRPKLLFGKLFYETSELQIDVKTDHETEQLLVRPGGGYTVSGPVEVRYDTASQTTYTSVNLKPGDYFFNFRNMGAAVDVGINYRFANKSEVTLGIIDLGFTGLKHHTYEVEYTDQIRFPQDELYQSNDSLMPHYIEPKEALRALNDSIPGITMARETGKRIYVALPVKINAAYKHQLSQTLWIGFSNQFTFIKNHSDNYFSGFINARLNRFELAANINLYNFRKVLPGFGAGYTGEHFQYYLATNNILGLVQPASAKNVNLSLGVNILFDTGNN